MPISDDCYHIPTSPGQKMCGCLDLIVWLRLLVELQARRIVELETTAQRGVARILHDGGCGDQGCDDCAELR